MATPNKCSNCGSTIVFGGKGEGDNYFCNQVCLENYKYPGFCPDCIAETTDESPGGTTTVNGIGTTLYLEIGNAAKCPTCYSIIKKKWFCFVYIPIAPLKTYRIKRLPRNRYLGRLLPPAHLKSSRLRTAGSST